jgi:hypothetical protein
MRILFGEPNSSTANTSAFRFTAGCVSGREMAKTRASSSLPHAEHTSCCSGISCLSELPWRRSHRLALRALFWLTRMDELIERTLRTVMARVERLLKSPGFRLAT